MSSSRLASKAKASASSAVSSKKTGSSSTASSVLVDSTNLHGSSVPKKSAGLSHTRSSLVPNSLTTPITPRSGTQSTTARVPASVKSSENSSKNPINPHKTSETWAPMPTPVAISSSRSFSELMKSEESLLSKVNQLQALVDQQQRALSEKDIEIKQLKLEVMNGQEQATKIHRSWEAKSEAILAQQQEKYQDLNDRYFQVLTRARACESKLEELFVDPLTMEPFGQKTAERLETQTSLQQQLTILNLVEEHQRKEDSVMERNQRETEQLLAQTLKEIGNSHEIDIHDLLSSVRSAIPPHTDEELKKIELSVPNLFIESQPSSHTPQIEYDSDNLDWSIATTDDAHEYSPASQKEELPPFMVPTIQPLQSVPWRLETSTASEDGFESGSDDSFFNESIHENA